MFQLIPVSFPFLSHRYSQSSSSESRYTERFAPFEFCSAIIAFRTATSPGSFPSVLIKVTSFGVSGVDGLLGVSGFVGFSCAGVSCVVLCCVVASVVLFAFFLFFTVTLQTYFLPFTFAVIFALPAFLAVTTPFLLTVAIFFLLLLQVIFFFFGAFLIFSVTFLPTSNVTVFLFNCTFFLAACTLPPGTASSPATITAISSNDVILLRFFIVVLLLIIIPLDTQESSNITILAETIQKANPIYQNTDISDWLLYSFRPVIPTIRSTNKAPSVSALLCFALLCFALLCFALLNPSLIIGICQVLSCIIYNIPRQYFPVNAFFRKWQSFTKLISSLSVAGNRLNNLYSSIYLFGRIYLFHNISDCIISLFAI